MLPPRSTPLSFSKTSCSAKLACFSPLFWNIFGTLYTADAPFLGWGNSRLMYLSKIIVTQCKRGGTKSTGCTIIYRWWISKKLIVAAKQRNCRRRNYCRDPVWPLCTNQKVVAGLIFVFLLSASSRESIFMQMSGWEKMKCSPWQINNDGVINLITLYSLFLRRVDFVSKKNQRWHSSVDKSVVCVCHCVLNIRRRWICRFRFVPRYNLTINIRRKLAMKRVIIS